MLHVRDGEHISLFFVRPDRQGQRIGHALIEAADRTTPDHPLASVNSSTNAVRSYERYGFKASGPEQVSDGIRFVPMRPGVTRLRPHRNARSGAASRT